MSNVFSISCSELFIVYLKFKIKQTVYISFAKSGQFSTGGNVFGSECAVNIEAQILDVGTDSCPTHLLFVGNKVARDSYPHARRSVLCA